MHMSEDFSLVIGSLAAGIIVVALVILVWWIVTYEHQSTTQENK